MLPRRGHAGSRSIDLVSLVVLAAIVGGIAHAASLAARAKPFWHDEIYTILVARLPTVAAIWAAMHDGIDLQPPLNTLATRGAWALFGAGPITTRLPALAGFCLMTVMVFVMLKQRTNLPLAAAGALLPVQTAAYRYAYEARGYGLMLGLFTVALYAWTEAARDRRRRIHLPMLGLALAAGVWTHYYAALGLALIALGECARQWIRRRVDMPMWIAIGAAIVALTPLVPLVRNASAQRARFWAQPGIERIADVYAGLMQPALSELFSLWGALLAAAALAAAWRRRRAQPSPGDTLPTHEVVVVAGAALVPLAAWLLGTFVIGAFTPRYGLSGVVGLALGLPLLVWRVAPGRNLAALILCVIVALPFAQTVVVVLRSPPALTPNPVAQRPLLADVLSGAGPVVAAGSLTYLQLWYYAPRLTRSRLVYLADPNEAVRFTGSDTIDRGYLVLARWTPVRVEPYDVFMERQRQFTIYAAGGGWLLDKLAETGATVNLAGSEPGGQLYRVTR